MHTLSLVVGGLVALGIFILAAVRNPTSARTFFWRHCGVGATSQ